MGGENYVALPVHGFSKQMSYSDIIDWQTGKVDANRIDLEIYVKSFDYNTAKGGDRLELFGVEVRPGVRVPWPRLQYADPSLRLEDYYYWEATANDKVTFVSFKDDILTVNIENLNFLPERSIGGIPEQFTVKGNISCRMD